MNISIKKQKMIAPSTGERFIEIWESAVSATHNFLQEEDIVSLRPRVLQAFHQMDFFLTAQQSDSLGIAFLACKDNKIEMLFVHDECGGKGIGRLLIQESIEKYRAKYVDVNEQNTEGVGFYKHLGFKAFKKSECDGQGNPFPILHMVLANK